MATRDDGSGMQGSGGVRDGAWWHAEEAARAGAAELTRARERMRVARHRADDRRRCAERALAAGQDEAAHVLLEAASAHDVAAAEAHLLVVALERRQATLVREAETREAHLVCVVPAGRAEPGAVPLAWREAA